MRLKALKPTKKSHDKLLFLNGTTDPEGSPAASNWPLESNRNAWATSLL